MKVLKNLFDLFENYGVVAEWLGSGLQNHLQRFESARRLKEPSTNVEGFFIGNFYKILIKKQNSSIYKNESTRRIQSLLSKVIVQGLLIVINLNGFSIKKKM